jgi:hypothetical protein
MTINIPRSWKGVRNAFQAAPDQVSSYYESLPSLLEEYVWEVSVAYAFLKIEKTHNYILYAGVRKIHRAEATVASKLIDSHHLTRRGFETLFENIFGVPIPREINSILKEAEKVRDKVIHGKSVNAKDQRKALMLILKYSIDIEEFIQGHAGFSPFSSDRRGLTGRGESLDKSTTTWLMRGLGFAKKEEKPNFEADA